MMHLTGIPFVIRKFLKKMEENGSKTSVSIAWRVPGTNSASCAVRKM